jgi:hypothetical protein
LSEKISLKKNDVLKIGRYKYIVYKISKGNIDLLPMNPMLESDHPLDFIPKIRAEVCKLKNHEVVDNYELFYLLNQKSPLVKEVLNSFFENERRNEKRNSRKN